MTAPADVESYIDQLVTDATALLTDGEVLLASFRGEHSDFVRFNHGDVRQAGSVHQLDAELDLSLGKRHTAMSLALSFDSDADAALIAGSLDTMRARRDAVPEDPFFSYNDALESSSHTNPGSAPGQAEIVDRIHTAAGDDDFVGIWAAGPQFAAFANSLGQRNWFQSTTFNLDWSLYLRADKASKQGYAGFDWDDSTFDDKLAMQRRELEVLARPPIELEPGDYRTYLTPSAVSEFASMLSWGGFSIRDHNATDSPLLKMVTEGRHLSPKVTITENTAGGVAPNFGGQGFVKPNVVPLITAGEFDQHLVSPRSAEEFSVASNGADGHEGPASIALAPGSLPTGDALGELGTGLHIGNLWYLNFSDRANCRITGMTRFASFWAENGELVAPVTAMRFDDTLFELLGERLVDFTDTAEVQLDPLSYGARSTHSATLPGMLTNAMRFTL